MVLKATSDVTSLTDEQKAEAIRIVMEGLGQFELELANSYVSPLTWSVDDGTGNSKTKGGSMFFLDTGEATFGVTAGHVVQEFFNDTRKQRIHCAIAAHGKSPLRIPLGERMIDGSSTIDIATFRILPEEIRYFNKTPLRGHTARWPPPLPQIDSPSLYCGFPGVGRRPVGGGISYGAVPMAGMITNSHETAISIQIDRDVLVRMLGEEDMPENFNFGGISGGPLISIIQGELQRTWRPAGVLISGPNPGNDSSQQSIAGFEVIWARPIHFIKANGELDLDRWENSNF